MIDIIEPFIVLILILFQSIFGVGLLMFGTPIFILFDYSFPETLSLLLPISIIISSLQFFLSSEKNNSFIFDFNIFCIPFVIIFLYLALIFHQTINFKLYTAVIIILFSIINLFKIQFLFKNKFSKITKKIILILIGTIHGLTNLGGSLLAIFSTSVSDSNKNLSRYFISYSYMAMAFIQIIILSIFENEYFNYKSIYYIILVFVIYFPTQNLFKKFNDKRFSKFTNIFTLIFGLFVLLNSFN
ncbi:hypothetical protein N9I08_04220 [Candidatus Pelagibacter sp.]|jgi:uncharacterized protein|nr:hypothetical protein [Candidatus Pelagibacter sp.]|tara:strand:- start:202 stop:930 length:729 start_codon:yes stop_codon:yes gene_type:complete